MSPDEIRELIRVRGMTQVDIARRINITAGSVNDIIQGRTRSATARFALAMVLGVDPEAIWPREPAEPTPSSEEVA